MVRIRFAGRLGNQMFQYAAAYAVASRTNTRISIDLTNFGDLDKRGDFELWRFPRTGMRRISAVRSILIRTSRKLFPREATYQMGGLGWDPKVLTLNGNTFMAGWFQSARYFADVQADIRRTFDLAPHLRADEWSKVQQAANGRRVVGVHVRRGDYLSDGTMNSDLSDYYLAALDHFPLNFMPVVFSDDIAWCKITDLFAKREVYFADFPVSPSRPPVCDMALFANCDAHVCANSTFSWWGAYLSPRSADVLVPKKWLREWDIYACGLDVEGWRVV